MSELSQSYLKSILHYDKDTGDFVWKFRPELRPTWNTRYANKTAGRIANNGYCQICIDYKQYSSHRLAWFYIFGEWPNQIDHINLDKLDNRMSNLRECSQSQNRCNVARHKDNKSGYKGVTYHAMSKKWMARIIFHGNNKYLGTFHTPEEAHVVYCNAAKDLHGEFARTA